MNNRDKELKEIFIAESMELCNGISLLLTRYEKDSDDARCLAEMFRSLHNLKANARSIGYMQVADIAHKLETLCSGLRSNELGFTAQVATLMFDGVDLLTLMLQHMDDPDFKGPDQEMLQLLEQVTSDLGSAQEHLSSIKKIYKNDQQVVLSDLVQIKVKKLDDLLNLVGELIIDKDRLVSISRSTGKEDLRSVCAHLERITSELQQSVMDVRLVNLGYLFNKFPRTIRDLALANKKKIQVVIGGADIKVDRNILQIISDSILHIIRNAVDHGIEEPEERLEKGKKEESRLEISANNEKEQVLIRIIDDGRGIDLDALRSKIVADGLLPADKVQELPDNELLSFLFEPGFSLSRKVSDISGRGVGLDVVKNSIDSVGGKITISSVKGEGTTFSLLVPTSIAVKAALLFEIGRSPYAIPLVNTLYVQKIDADQVHQLGEFMIVKLKEELIPLIDLKLLFRSNGIVPDLGNTNGLAKDILDVIIVTYHNRKLALIVDRLLRQQDIVVKPLNADIHDHNLFGGVTILGTGEVCLVLDVPSITKTLIIGLKNEEVII